MSNNVENKVKFGISNLHIAKITATNDGITYGIPFAIPGIVGLSIDPEGDMTKFYADNIVYYIANSNQGYSGDLETAMIPKEFLKQILGQTEDANGALIENADDTTSRFAIMGEIEGDVKKRRFVYYDCTATRPKTELATAEDKKEPKTDKVTLTMAPRSTDKVVKATMEPSDTNQAAYDSFFTQVYEKVIAPSL